eukprot:849552-Rhodomonas_salina.1
MSHTGSFIDEFPDHEDCGVQDTKHPLHDHTREKQLACLRALLAILCTGTSVAQKPKTNPDRSTANHFHSGSQLDHGPTGSRSVHAALHASLAVHGGIRGLEEHEAVGFRDSEISAYAATVSVLDVAKQARRQISRYNISVPDTI